MSGRDPQIVKSEALSPEDPAIRPPASLTRFDADWNARIERAKRAHEEGRKAREGKSPTLSIRQSL